MNSHPLSSISAVYFIGVNIDAELKYLHGLINSHVLLAPAAAAN
jgi:hypothetical protein